MKKERQYFTSNRNVKKHNYLSNKNILKEIHKSKISFCEYTDKMYTDYDFIVRSLSEINSDVIALAKNNRVNRLADVAIQEAVELSADVSSKKVSDFAVDVATILDTDVVFRLMTWEHIPFQNPRAVEDEDRDVTDDIPAEMLPFAPFKHFVIDSIDANGEFKFKEVLRSHFKNGVFSARHGKITDTLGAMFILMAKKYGERGNWRNYSYVDEMMGQARLQLSARGLQFDESKSDNPFSYYTTFLNNSFTKVFNIEKDNQRLRDNLLISHGMNPSFTRQMENDSEISAMRDGLYDSND